MDSSTRAGRRIWHVPLLRTDRGARYCWIACCASRTCNVADSATHAAAVTDVLPPVLPRQGSLSYSPGWCLRHLRGLRRGARGVLGTIALTLSAAMHD